METLYKKKDMLWRFLPHDFVTISAAPSVSDATAQLTIADHVHIQQHSWRGHQVANRCCGLLTVLSDISQCTMYMHVAWFSSVDGSGRSGVSSQLAKFMASRPSVDCPSYRCKMNKLGHPCQWDPTVKHIVSQHCSLFLTWRADRRSPCLCDKASK